jgi:hypothetical protein
MEEAHQMGPTAPINPNYPDVVVVVLEYGAPLRVVVGHDHDSDYVYVYDYVQVHVHEWAELIVGHFPIWQRSLNTPDARIFPVPS